MVWTVGNGTGRLLIPGHGSFAEITFSPDGRNLIIGACGCPPDALEGVRIYDASTGQHAATTAGHQADIRHWS